MPLRDYKYNLRDLAEQNNKKIDWNAQSGTVSIDGKPFDTTGWQNIDGRFKGTGDMAIDFLSKPNLPSGNIAGSPPMGRPEPKPNVMQGPSGNVVDSSTPLYSDEINKTTRNYGEAVQGFGKDFNLENDPVYKSLADYTERRMMKLAARTGSEYDSNTQARIAQANTQLGLQFQQANELKQLQNIQNLQGQLGTMTGLEDRALQRDQTIYGMALTPETRDYMNTMQNITPEQRQYIDQYSDNFAAQINNLPEGDERRTMLEAARFQKVISDPMEYRDYLINDYGLSPFQVDNIAINKKMEELQSMATNEKESLELQKLQAQVDKAMIDAERAEQGLSKDMFDTFMSQVKASNIKDKEKAELDNVIARTYNSHLKSQIDIEKLEEISKSSEPMVQQGFIDFVASGLSFDEWLDTPVNPAPPQMSFEDHLKINVRDRFSFSKEEKERPVYYTELLTPAQIVEVAKVAKNAGFFADTSGVTIIMGDELKKYKP